MKVATLAVIVTTLCACSHRDPTEIIVVVGSDLMRPGELSWIEAEVWNPTTNNWEPRAIYDGGLPPDEMIPLSFGLVPRNDDASRLAWVRVKAHASDNSVHVTAAARTHFIENHITRLPMFLARSCIDTTCDPDMTCERGTCVGIDVGCMQVTTRGHELDDGGAPLCRDASTDDGGVDAGPTDGGVDAGPTDGGVTRQCDGGPCAGDIVMPQRLPGSAAVDFVSGIVPSPSSSFGAVPVTVLLGSSDYAYVATNFDTAGGHFSIKQLMADFSDDTSVMPIEIRAATPTGLHLRFGEISGSSDPLVYGQVAGTWDVDQGMPQTTTLAGSALFNTVAGLRAHSPSRLGTAPFVVSATGATGSVFYDWQDISSMTVGFTALPASGPGWTKSYRDDDVHAGIGRQTVALGGANELLVAGQFSGSLAEFSGAPQVTSRMSDATFLAVLARDTGAFLWGCAPIETRDVTWPVGIASDGAGGILAVVAFRASGSANGAGVVRCRPGPPNTWQGSFNVFENPDGALGAALVVAVAHGNGFLVAGAAATKIGLGLVNVPTGSNRAAFVAELRADGTVPWMNVWPSSGYSSVTALASDPNTGEILAGGMFTGRLTIGDTVWTNGSWDPFMVRLRPP